MSCIRSWKLIFFQLTDYSAICSSSSANPMLTAVVITYHVYMSIAYDMAGSQTAQTDDLIRLINDHRRWCKITG